MPILMRTWRMVATKKWSIMPMNRIRALIPPLPRTINRKDISLVSKAIIAQVTSPVRAVINLVTNSVKEAINPVSRATSPAISSVIRNNRLPVNKTPMPRVHP